MNSEFTDESWNIVKVRLKQKFAMLSDKETEIYAVNNDTITRKSTTSDDNTNDELQN